MFIGIHRPQRRTLLRTVLQNFLNTPPQQVSPEAARLYAEMANEARLMLQEIAVSESATKAQQSGATITQEKSDAS